VEKTFLESSIIITIPPASRNKRESIVFFEHIEFANYQYPVKKTAWQKNTYRLHATTTIWTKRTSAGNFPEQGTIKVNY